MKVKNHLMMAILWVVISFLPVSESFGFVINSTSLEQEPVLVRFDEKNFAVKAYDVDFPDLKFKWGFPLQHQPSNLVMASVNRVDEVYWLENDILHARNVKDGTKTLWFNLSVEPTGIKELTQPVLGYAPYTIGATSIRVLFGITSSGFGFAMRPQTKQLMWQKRLRVDSHESNTLPEVFHLARPCLIQLVTQQWVFAYIHHNPDDFAFYLVFRDLHAGEVVYQVSLPLLKNQQFESMICLDTQGQGVVDWILVTTSNGYLVMNIDSANPHHWYVVSMRPPIEQGWLLKGDPVVTAGEDAQFLLISQIIRSQQNRYAVVQYKKSMMTQPSEHLFLNWHYASKGEILSLLPRGDRVLIQEQSSQGWQAKTLNSKDGSCLDLESIRTMRLESTLTKESQVSLSPKKSTQVVLVKGPRVSENPVIFQRDDVLGTSSLKLDYEQLGRVYWRLNNKAA